MSVSQGFHGACPRVSHPHGRPVTADEVKASLAFQFTPREAGDRTSGRRRWIFRSFNSRPREAGDRDNYCNYRHRRHDIRRSTGDMIAYSVRNCSNKPAKSLQINCQRSRFPRTRRQLHVSLWFAQRFCNTMPEAHLHWDRPSLLLHSEPPFPRSCFPCYSTSGCQALDRI